MAVMAQAVRGFGREVVLGARLREAVRLLAAAAILGRAFDPPVLSRVLGEEDRSALTWLEEARATGVLEEAEGGYQFTHALVRETLAAELSSAEKVRMHARAAQALEGRYGAAAREHAEELAYHYAEAESVLGSAGVARWSLAAGERAVDALAYDEARRHFERGLAARQVEPMDVEKAALTWGLGKALAGLAVAQARGDVALQCRCHAMLSYILFLSCEFALAVSEGDAAIRLGVLQKDPRQAVWAIRCGYRGALCVGDTETARRSTAHAAAARKHLIPMTLHAVLDGDWEAAREAAELTRDLLPGERTVQDVAWAVAEHQRGRPDDGDVRLREIAAEMEAAQTKRLDHRHAAGALAMAVADSVSGRLRWAGQVERGARMVLARAHLMRYASRSCHAALGLLAVLRSDAPTARAEYGELEGSAGTFLDLGGVSVDGLLGLLARTTGDVERALGHFEAGLALCRRAGYRPELGWTCLDCAGALEARGKAGDAAKAGALLEEGARIARDLGMPPLLGRIEAVQARRRPGPSHPDGLSERELEVLRLIAVGRTNKEIAAALSISVKTAANHVTNLLAKTGLGNRTELAAYAHRHSLVGG